MDHHVVLTHTFPGSRNPLQAAMDTVLKKGDLVVTAQKIPIHPVLEFINRILKHFGRDLYAPKVQAAEDGAVDLIEGFYQCFKNDAEFSCDDEVSEVFPIKDEHDKERYCKLRGNDWHFDVEEQTSIDHADPKQQLLMDNDGSPQHHQFIHIASYEKEKAGLFKQGIKEIVEKATELVQSRFSGGEISTDNSSAVHWIGLANSEKFQLQIALTVLAAPTDHEQAVVTGAIQCINQSKRPFSLEAIKGISRITPNADDTDEELFKRVQTYIVAQPAGTFTDAVLQGAVTYVISHDNLGEEVINQVACHVVTGKNFSKPLNEWAAIRVISHPEPFINNKAAVMGALGYVAKNFKAFSDQLRIQAASLFSRTTKIEWHASDEPSKVVNLFAQWTIQNAKLFADSKGVLTQVVTNVLVNTGLFPVELLEGLLKDILVNYTDFEHKALKSVLQSVAKNSNIFPDDVKVQAAKVFVKLSDCKHPEKNFEYFTSSLIFREDGDTFTPDEIRSAVAHVVNNMTSYVKFNLPVIAKACVLPGFIRLHVTPDDFLHFAAHIFEHSKNAEDVKKVVKEVGNILRNPKSDKGFVFACAEFVIAYQNHFDSNDVHLVKKFVSDILNEEKSANYDRALVVELAQWAVSNDKFFTGDPLLERSKAIVLEQFKNQNETFVDLPLFIVANYQQFDSDDVGVALGRISKNYLDLSKEQISFVAPQISEIAESKGECNNECVKYAMRIVISKCRHFDENLVKQAVDYADDKGWFTGEKIKMRDMCVVAHPTNFKLADFTEAVGRILKNPTDYPKGAEIVAAQNFVKQNRGFFERLLSGVDGQKQFRALFANYRKGSAFDRYAMGFGEALASDNRKVSIQWAANATDHEYCRQFFTTGLDESEHGERLFFSDKKKEPEKLFVSAKDGVFRLKLDLYALLTRGDFDVALILNKDLVKHILNNVKSEVFGVWREKIAPPPLQGSSNAAPHTQ